MAHKFKSVDGRIDVTFDLDSICEGDTIIIDGQEDKVTEVNGTEVHANWDGNELVYGIVREEGNTYLEKR